MARRKLLIQTHVFEIVTSSVWISSGHVNHGAIFRLQTGMRGAFGKPQGTVARVRIGQAIMSVRSSDRYREAVIEALRRAKFKFPGRQKVS